MKAKPTASKPGRMAKQSSEQVCNELRQERDQLLLEVAKLQTERDLYKKAIYALTWEDFDIDKKALLAQLGKGQSLEALISELESREAN